MLRLKPEGSTRLSVWDNGEGRSRVAPPSGGATREVVVARDPSRGPLKAVRSLLLQSSQAELKNLGLYDAYLAHMDPDALTQIQANIGPGWLPSELAIAHYSACDRLALTPSELAEVGSRASKRFQGGMLSTFASAARQSGFTPWLVIAAYGRIADRMFDGSSAEFAKVGPKDLEIGVQGNPLFGSRYFRAAYSVVTRSTFLVLGTRAAHVRLSSYRPEEQALEARISWV